MLYKLSSVPYFSLATEQNRRQERGDKQGISSSEYEGVMLETRSSPWRRRGKGDARIATRVGNFLDQLLRGLLPCAPDAVAAPSWETARLGRPRGARVQGRPADDDLKKLLLGLDGAPAPSTTKLSPLHSAFSGAGRSIHAWVRARSCCA